jgi:hypothetical protein
VARVALAEEGGDGEGVVPGPDLGLGRGRVAHGWTNGVGGGKGEVRERGGGGGLEVCSFLFDG